MLSRSPDFVDPWHFADIGKRISGTLMLVDLPRLARFLQQPGGEAKFELEFFRDQRKRACISGFVKADLVLQCQRCLGPLRLAVDSEINLVAVEGFDEAEQLPESTEPLLMEESRVRLEELVEDELLLSIPQVPRHTSGACATDNIISDSVPPDHAEDDEDEVENPFAELATLKSKQTETE
jgi:uncharacterized protein